MRRRGAILTALGLIAAGGLALGNTPAAQAAVACKVAYTASEWQGGMSANLSIQNLGDALNGWTLTFTFPTAVRRSPRAGRPPGASRAAP
ncbi:cellulose binding domain-containing protein [Microbispora sp. CA-135349]|uniref:cellulose binding domain-containing protein n=1 Tax=Microbispora sp. CA-135349 TaxID=3239953 RepID=UPI003D94B10E